MSILLEDTDSFSVLGVPLLFSDYSLDAGTESPAQAAIQITGTEAVSPWFDEVLDRLHELSRRPPGWDSYAALPTSLESVEAAMRFLANTLEPGSPAPTVVPLPDGGVQLEWHRRGLDVEVAFPVTDEPDFYALEVDTGRRYEFDPTADLAAAKTLLGRLSE